MTEPGHTGWRARLAKLVKYGFIALGVFVVVVGVWVIHTYRYRGEVDHISFQSGDVTMKGLLIKPDGPGPHPVVVLLHGSGPLPGDGPPVRIMANALLKSGIGFLTYDKRGVGSSGGTFHRNAYGDFIDDGINAVRYLASREDIDSDAIGLLGSSEGSIIAPEIAVRSGKVAFVIHRSGIAVDGIETSLWQTRHELIHSGFTGGLLEDLVQIRGLIFRILVDADANPALVDSDEWRHVNAEITAFNQRYAQDEVWLKKGKNFRIGNMLKDWSTFFKSVATAIGYDPRPYIEQLDIPMLYIFAGNDENVPTEASVKYLKGLESDPEKDIETIVIPGVDHTMITPASFVFEGGFVPEFLDAIGPWAATRISAKSASQ